MALNLHKDHKMYYSIKEVAQMFNVTEVQLRFWEKKMPTHLTPKKGSSGARQYTKENIEQVRVIVQLIKERGLRLDAANKALKGNHEGTLNNVEAIERLKAIRDELRSISQQIGGLE